MNHHADELVGDPRARALALVVLGAGSMAVWAPLVGWGVLWAAPMLAFATFLALVGPGPRTGALGIAVAAAFPVWLVVAPLLAGVSPAAFMPGALGATGTALTDAFLGLRGSTPGDPWTVTLWLVLSGGAWFIGSLQAVRTSKVSVALAFCVLCVPVAAVVLLRQVDGAAWHGALVLAAALLWSARSELRAAIPAIGGVALLALVVSVAVGPRERLVDLTPLRPDFAQLDPRQTYGPQEDDRPGAKMLEIQASTPALWRSQVLENFDGRGWTIDPVGRPELPQPRAVSTRTSVTVRGLRDPIAVGPGRIASAAIAGRVPARPAQGEGVYFADPPPRDATYEVVSSAVGPDRSMLRDDPVAVGPDLVRLKSVGGVIPDDLGTPLADAVDTMPAAQLATPTGRIYQLAHDLSDGADSQLEIVERVEAYLLDPRRFRYELDVPRPGPQPLADFLLQTRAGYCQHFAGAAALLLRLAGVPTRVAVGFATGSPMGDGRWEVLDLDAHAWIEVYFPSTGWVPFNPTPSDAEARIPASVDGAGSDRSVVASPGGSPLIGVAVLVAVLAVAAVAALRRRRRDPRPPVALGEALAALLPAPTGPDRTLTELQPELARIGPAVAALGREAEARRFAPGGGPPERHPRRRVLRAVLSDLGLVRTARLLVLGPGRRPVVDDRTGPGVVRPSVAPPSVAPPPARPPTAS